ncbi:MAG: hypothetical protein K0R29_2714 [Pseudobdellovibrio sp.]|nr:hypothetical protein [Pseudobdellovibrio sp.]
MQNQSVTTAHSASAAASKTRVFLQENFFAIVAVLTFFLLITAQTLWSTIHGDGAVYAWLARELAGGWTSAQLPRWDHTNAYADHPYLFIYFASLFVKFFGSSDIVLKLPNYLVAAFSLFTVYKASQLSAGKKVQSVGIIAGYALLLNATYIIQISQPSLDPMAQWLSLVSILVLVFGRSAFLAGILMGAAFLTKGLELLPNLAALILTAVYIQLFVQRRSLKAAAKISLITGAGVLIPVAAWLLLDQAVWAGQWSATYWQRQFVNRFFNPNGADKSSQFGYVMTAIQVYFLEFFIFGVWFAATDAWKRKRRDPLFVSFLIYLAFNMAAFVLIKKDSSQHVTGILVAGSVFVGEAVYDIWKKMGSRRLWAVPVSLLVVAFAYWSWFFINAENNPDMWTAVKNEAQIFRGELPVVVRDSTGESYGIFYTAQWYSKSDNVYFQSDADRLLVGHEVVYLAPKDNGQLDAARVVYQKGLF